MKLNSKTILGIFVICAMFIFVPFLIETVIAQPPPPALPGVPSQAPIDGGLTLLAAAGGAYAWKKLRNRQV
jgi:hypothetical protein